MNFKTREDYAEHVAYCTDETHGILNNYEGDYEYLQKLIKKPYSIRVKAGLLRARYGDLHNGFHNVGRYTRFTDIVRAEMAE